MKKDYQALLIEELINQRNEALNTNVALKAQLILVSSELEELRKEKDNPQMELDFGEQ